MLETGQAVAFIEQTSAWPASMKLPQDRLGSAFGLQHKQFWVVPTSFLGTPPHVGALQDAILSDICWYCHKTI